MSDVEPKLSHPTGCNKVPLLLPSAVVSELVERLDFHHYSMVKRSPSPKGPVVATWGAVMKQSSLSQPGRYQWRHSEELELPSLPSTDEEPLSSSVSRGQAGDHLLYPPIGDCNELAHSPSLSVMQQCQKKPVKTVASIRFRISQLYTPNAHVSIEKSLIIPRTMRISH